MNLAPWNQHERCIEGRSVSLDSTPSVSIGMPVYNCAATLEIAVRSILNQMFEDWELLLIDDGSTDETADLAKRYSDPRIHVLVDGLSLGLGSRLNQAIGLSRGRYFARMDGDDVSYPERLALQARYLSNHPEVDLVGGGVLVFGREGRLLGKHKAPTDHESICRRPWKGLRLAHPTWMGKTAWFRKHLYRSDAVRCEDQELLLRTYESSRFAAISQIVLGYREEKLSLSKILTGRRHFTAAVCRRAILRRQYWIGVAAIAEQALKGIADSVATSTGLKYQLLRHRALPVTEKAAVQRWKEVWEELNECGGSSAACKDQNAAAYQVR